MLCYKLHIIKIVDLHGLAYIREGLCSLGAGHFRALAQDLIYLRDVLLVMRSSLSHRLQELLHDVEEELLACTISQSAATVVVLHLLEVCILRKILREMLVCAECVEIGEYHVALNVTRVGDLEMLRVGVHAVHLLLDLLRRVREIYAVSEGLAHLGLSVSAGEAAACRIFRKHHLRSHESLAVYCIELMHDLACLLNHRSLVNAHRYRCSTERRDV